MKACNLPGLEICEQVQVQYLMGVEDLGGAFTFKDLPQTKSLQMWEAVGKREKHQSTETDPERTEKMALSDKRFT